METQRQNDREINSGRRAARKGKEKERPGEGEGEEVERGRGRKRVID
jgi:hypothetical protein